jgi:hypothetical protein
MSEVGLMRVRSGLLGLLLLTLPAAGTTQDKNGGSAKSGLAWILKAQNRDGGWGLDAGQDSDITCTSLAALALMAGANTERGGPDPKSVEAVRKALAWIMREARRHKTTIDGGVVTLVQNKLGTHVHSFFATVFLSQIYGMQGPWVESEDPEEIRAALVKMTEHIARTQEPDGSWHKTAFGGLKATAMAWLALRSSHSVGINIRSAAVDKIIKFMKSEYDPATGLFTRSRQYGGYQTIYAATSCLRVFYGMGEAKSEMVSKATTATLQTIRSMTRTQGAEFLSCEGEDYLAAAMLTQALMRIHGSQVWNEWFEWITAMLQKKQNNDGSWTGTACISGRTFATACALLALQAPNKILPLQEL